jgi:ribonuclease BN (tRNA processing enzyme)
MGQPGTTPINVYGPPRTEDLVEAAIQYFTISAELRIAVELLFFDHGVVTGLIYQDANIKITAIENTRFAFHAGPAAGKLKSYSWFETPGWVIAFTGDTGSNGALTELARGADLLVSEVNSVRTDFLRSGGSVEGSWGQIARRIRILHKKGWHMGGRQLAESLGF